jgi:hypothetical protein
MKLRDIEELVRIKHALYREVRRRYPAETDYFCDDVCLRFLLIECAYAFAEGWWAQHVVKGDAK